MSLFSSLKLSKLHMYETYYGTLQPYFGQENLQLRYIDTDGMILSMKTKDIIKDLKKLEDIFDFRNLDENHELFSEKNKKVIGKSKSECPKNIWIDEFVCLRSKAYSFKCKNNDDKYCFIWSILADLHPCDNTNPSRINNYKQYFNELNFQSFDFTNGFKCSDVHRFNELNNLSGNIYEINFYQDGDKWKHNLIPIVISKSESDNVIDLLI